MPLFDLLMGVLSVKNRTRISAIPVKNGSASLFCLNLFMKGPENPLGHIFMHDLLYIFGTDASLVGKPLADQSHHIRGKKAGIQVGIRVGCVLVREGFQNGAVHRFHHPAKQVLFQRN